MDLRSLLQALPGAHAQGPVDVAVSGVTADSRAVKAGSVFVAMPGATAQSRHGREFVPAALAAGAVAVVTDDAGLAAPTRILVDNVPAALAFLAEAFQGNPSRRLRLLGVTGTNGKTTTAHMLEAMAAAAGEGTGFLGTTAVRVRDQERPATHTTPPAEVLSALMAEMVQAGVTTCAMEVSSHSLEQRRVEALRFAGAIFTNLTQDHLDFHGSLDRYFAAKCRLFTELLPAGAPAIINVDDERVASLASLPRVRVVSFSATGRPADVRVVRQARVDNFTEVDAASPWGVLHLRTPLLGTYNVANLLGAVALHLATGTPLAAVLAGAEHLALVPGRLESVRHPRGAHVLVDYAHTPDALARALDAVRPAVGPGGRLFCVFGCGGNRDAGKRPKMGAAAAERADVVVVTNDNPRNEEPPVIANAIVDGVRGAGMAEVGTGLVGRGYCVELDRAAAIALAVRAARCGDVVLLAGKGHEREQVFADRKVPFDDRQAASDAMAGMEVA